MTLTPEQILALDLGLAADQPAGQPPTAKPTSANPGRRVLLTEAHPEDYEAWLKTESQAAVVIRKCGGPGAVAKLIDYDPSQVFRWRYPEKPHKKRGTGGIIPRRALRRLTQWARINGVLLSDADLTPRRYPGPGWEPTQNRGGAGGTEAS